MSEVYPAKGLFDDVLPGLPGRPLAKASKRKAGGKRKGGVARLQEAVLAGGPRGALAVSLGRGAKFDREDAQ